MGNTFADTLKEGMFEKMKAVAEASLTKEEREEIKRYEEDHFRTVNEMVEHMRRGGRVSPLVCSSICDEGYTMNGKGIVLKKEVVYDSFGVPACINKGEYTVEEFLNSDIFNLKHNGFIMCWIKK